ncbi:MAG: SCP2 sterol-binding domain-containing protein [Solirubrobacteraceae bacterium]|nr:SCP2 sterol-binding domain-containing protein [Solirubrobacteraceae bacterium]
MAYFNDSAEVYEYIGGVFRDAGKHPEVGPKLRAAGIVLRFNYSDPESVLTVKFTEDFDVVEGESDLAPDITLTMPADIAHQYWRGEYNLAVGLAKGKVKAKGPVNQLLKLVPLTKPLFPMYKTATDERGTVAVGG